VILLDTHVWIWHVAGDVRRVGRSTIRLLKRSADLDVLRLSPLTIFEVSSLHAAGRIELSPTLDRWIAAAMQDGGVRLAPLTMEMARQAGAIGAMSVRDPLDRLLIATARERGYRRLSLETGSMDYFAPARALYARHGFVVCEPFEGYKADPNSVFLTLDLAADRAGST